MADDEKRKLHIAMFPWLAFGHLIPFQQLSKLIAQKGHKISFISTPRNIDRLPKLPSNLALLVNYVSLSLPPADNLPPQAEATADLPTENVPYLKIAYDGLQESVTRFLEASKPDWIIYDFAPYWLPTIAAQLDIFQAYFSIFWAATLCFIGPSGSSLITGADPRTEPEDFTVSPNWVPFPSNLAFPSYQAKKLFSQHRTINDSGVSDMFRFGSIFDGCQMFAVRSSREVEPEWLSLLQDLYQKPVMTVGLLPPPRSMDSVDDGDGGDGSWPTICEWLEKQKKGSVIYVAFGSEAEVSQEELTELAFGLELSNLPFFWVLRKGDGDLPDGFVERTRTRTRGGGVVWTSWAPQLRILGHDSVGGFLTHCGWSSVIEGLSFGRVLVMLPLATDQVLIARGFGEKKMGIEIPRNEEDGSFTRDFVAETVRLAMEDEEGRVYRDKAKEAREIFGDKEINDRYVDKFVDSLLNYRGLSTS